MKKMKSFMLVTATILLLAVMFCVNVSAAEWKALGDGLFYSFDKETEVMVIKGEGEISSGFFGIDCPKHYIEDECRYDPDEIDGYLSDYIETEFPERYEAFCAATRTKTLLIQEGVTALASSAFAFDGVFDKLEVVILPQSITEIPAGAFWQLGKLHTVVLSASTASIGEKAFAYCAELKNIYIPDTVKEIAEDAFEGCDMDNIRIPSAFVKPEKISKVSATQTSSTIKLTWSASKGATGYRIYYKSGSSWKVAVSSTTATSHTFKNLKAGARFTFAIRPYIKTNSGVVWASYTSFKASTVPVNPTIKVASPSKGKVTVSWNAVNGADAYQLWYKTGNGSYKLYKTYDSVKNLTFKNLKSGTKYTFAVRAVIKIDGSNVRSGYKAVAVTVK